MNEVQNMQAEEYAENAKWAGGCLATFFSCDNNPVAVRAAVYRGTRCGANYRIDYRHRIAFYCDVEGDESGQPVWSDTIETVEREYKAIRSDLKDALIKFEKDASKRWKECNR
jgi:hypothetical protein